MKTKKSKSAAAPAPIANAPDLARNADDKIWKDSRFAHLVSDPRFKNIAKSTRAVKIDKRFESMFKDDKFNVKYTVDKRGRPTKKSTSDDLKKYYEMSSGDEEDEAEEQRKELAAISKDDDDKQVVQPLKKKTKKEKKSKAIADDDEDEAAEAAVDEDDSVAQLGSSDEEELPSTLRDKLKDLTVDYARGESALWSDDSSDDESSEDGEGAGGELFIEHVWGALDLDAPRTEESTPRLAVCNMDWDRIRAADIMVLCNSFLPPGGAILSVTIYPSEFGKERMAEEELKGPQELTEKKLGAAKGDRAGDSDSDFDLGTDDEADDDDDAEDSDDGTKAREDDEAEEGDDYNMEKLRQYQLNRLKYYYAVIECNSVGAADKIYAECDGMEYESTATKLDLRFVPDDMVFEDEPKDVCREMPDTSKYMPRLFTTTALQQAKVELTWDENDLDRKELNDKLAAGKLSEVGDHELRKYVAYSSEEEDEEETEEQQPKVEKLKSKKSGKKVAADDAEEEEISNSGGKKKNDSLSKYKALLAEINEKESEKKNNRIEMEFSWGIGMKDKASKADDPSDDESAADSDDNDARVSKLKPKKTDPEQTHFDRIIEFKREKKRARKEEQKLKRKKFRKGAAGEDDSDSEIGGNGNLDSDSDGDVPDGIDLNDPYFAEEFANGDFVAPKAAKKSAKNKKKKRRGDEEVDSEEEREKAELALLLDDGDDGDKRAHFSLKKIQAAESETKSKRKRKAVLRRSKKQNVAEKEMLHADDFNIDTADDRFKAIYSSHLFSIDPTNPNFKKTKAMDALIEAKLKRAPSAAAEREQKADEPEAKKPKRNVETSMLVKSIKRKVQQAKQ